MKYKLEVCSKCKRQLPEYGTSLKFNFLVGEPLICEPCLATALGITHGGYNDFVYGKNDKRPY